MADTKTLPIKRFASSAAWDAWLQKHHTRSPGVWLEFAKKGRQSPPLSHAQALETALCYGSMDRRRPARRDGGGSASHPEARAASGRRSTVRRSTVCEPKGD